MSNNKNNAGAQENKEGWGEWSSRKYNEEYETWMPWMEDKYLAWFGGGDNKASYAAKEQLNQTKVTGIAPVDQLQDNVNNAIGNQLGSKGIGGPLTDKASKEGMNRVERGGKDDSGSYGGPAASITDPLANNAAAAGGKLTEGAKGAGGMLGGLWGGGKK